MDLAVVCLLLLEQMDRSLKDHAKDFLNMACLTYYPDDSFFHTGLNEWSNACLTRRFWKDAEYVEWVLCQHRAHTCHWPCTWAHFHYGARACHHVHHKARAYSQIHHRVNTSYSAPPRAREVLYFWLVIQGFFSLPSLPVLSIPSNQLSSLVTSSPLSPSSPQVPHSSSALPSLRNPASGFTTGSALWHESLGCTSGLRAHELHLHPLLHRSASTWRSSAPPAGLWLCLHHHGGLRLVCLCLFINSAVSVSVHQ